jgi:hypothetical protein
MTRREQIEAWIKEPKSGWDASCRIDEIYDFVYAWKPPNSDRFGSSLVRLARLACASTICHTLQEHTKTREVAAQWVSSAFADLIDECEATPADDLPL